MQNLIQFFTDYEKIILIIAFAVFFILSVMLYPNTGKIKYLTEVVDKMKYRSANYNVTECTDNKTGEIKTVVNRCTQSFEKLVPLYRLNKVTNELEKTDEFVDIQEQIESYKEMALQSMLERFIPKLVDDTADYTAVKGDLDFLTESLEIAEEYREKFGLSDTVTTQEIFSHMKKYSDELKVALDNAKNGGVKGEKKEIE